MNRLFIATLLTLCSLNASAIAGTDEAWVDAGRKVFAASQAAVVNIDTVIKITGEGAGAAAFGEREEKLQAIVTFIDASGLAVTSLYSVDPVSAMSDIHEAGPDGQEINIKLKSETTSLKIRLSDGTQIAARIVLKDEDLDLAFIAPEKPLDEATKSKLAVISFAEPTGAPLQILDRLFSLGREDAILSYAASMSMARVQAIIAKPRLAYVAGGAAMGSPVFKEDGKLLGITVARHADKHTRSNNPEREPVPVVIPASDVAKLIDQAKEEAGKAPEASPKKESPKIGGKPETSPKPELPKKAE